MGPRGQCCDACQACIGCSVGCVGCGGPSLRTGGDVDAAHGVVPGPAWDIERDCTCPRREDCVPHSGGGQGQAARAGVRVLQKHNQDVLTHGLRHAHLQVLPCEDLHSGGGCLGLAVSRGGGAEDAVVQALHRRIVIIVTAPGYPPLLLRLGCGRAFVCALFPANRLIFIAVVKLHQSVFEDVVRALCRAIRALQVRAPDVLRAPGCIAPPGPFLLLLEALWTRGQGLAIEPQTQRQRWGVTQGAGLEYGLDRGLGQIQEALL
mmetsp:Transcript_22315/g.40080  ORF Transcript_22315/g.40080 Transcript_22315/m.40080 type:complete len:263 (+) Transcript_22315:640-1428(+)